MVEGEPIKITWDKQALDSLQAAVEYIRKDSQSNAERVKLAILKIIYSLPTNPQKYPLDKFKKENSGNYRAFEKYSYRVSYRYTSSEIRILRIRHVKQEPKEF